MTLVDRIAVIALVLIAFAAPAAAQNIEAEALFRDGKRLMKEGKIGEACDKFEASERLESSVGTLLNLADCREKNKQLATAWAAFLKAEAAAKRAGNDAKRQAEAKKRAKDLEPRLSYLTISVPETSRIEGLTISRNGTNVDPALWNSGAPVDIGTYVIKASAPGHEPWSTEVTVSAEGEKASVEVPRFKAIEELVPDEPPPPPPDDGTKEVPLPPGDEPRDGGGGGTFTPMRYAAIGTGVLGVVALGAGVALGLEAKDLQSQADEICPEAACNDMAAVQLNEDAQGKAMQANIGFAVGGVAIAGAVALWILGAPDDERGEESMSLTPLVGGDRVGFALGGRF
jgi:tetratricopeptide (TPR) repeat protein